MRVETRVSSDIAAEPSRAPCARAGLIRADAQPDPERRAKLWSARRYLARWNRAQIARLESVWNDRVSLVRARPISRRVMTKRTEHRNADHFLAVDQRLGDNDRRGVRLRGGQVIGDVRGAEEFHASHGAGIAAIAALVGSSLV